MLTINPSADSICLGESILTTIMGTDFYSWSNGALSSVNTITPTYDTTLYLTGTSNFGCSNVIQFLLLTIITSSPAIVDTACKVIR